MSINTNYAQYSSFGSLKTHTTDKIPYDKPSIGISDKQSLENLQKSESGETWCQPDEVAKEDN
jgi:hypothetical protein